MPETLETLFNRYNSDKGSTVRCAHRYSRIYEPLFAPLREAPLRLMEIGLAQETVHRDCPSLRVWLEYFPNAQIFGYDINDHSYFQHERVRIFQGNQGDPNDLRRFMAWAGGPMDIVIDDGSHHFFHQQVSLTHLFDFVKPGGLYIIEDLHVRGGQVGPPGMAYTKELLRAMAHWGRDGIAEVSYPAIPNLRSILANIEGIAMHDSQSKNPQHRAEDLRDALAVIRKAATPVAAQQPRAGSRAPAASATSKRLVDVLGRLQDGLTRLWEAGPFPAVEVPIVAGDDAVAALSLGFVVEERSPRLYVRRRLPEGGYGERVAVVHVVQAGGLRDGGQGLSVPLLHAVRTLCERAVEAARAHEAEIAPVFDAAERGLALLESYVSRLSAP
ncbi:MAG TPA: hypothetical protein VFH51_00140 [Myxococcota bacterium]|nr:hypothetical protein [Myxococcota bacterium]